MEGAPPRARGPPMDYTTSYCRARGTYFAPLRRCTSTALLLR